MTLTKSPPQSVAPWFETQTEKDIIYSFFQDAFWSDESYLMLANKFNRQLELSNGKVYVLPMPTLFHQRISKRLFMALDQWLEKNKQGETLYAPHPIRLWPGKYREPDIMAWRTEHRGRMGEQESDPPDFALEIVSQSNETLDTEAKLKEYALAGIAEYWIVNPKLQRISVYTLAQREYTLVAQVGVGDKVASLIFSGFEISSTDLFSAE